MGWLINRNQITMRTGKGKRKSCIWHLITGVFVVGVLIQYSCRHSNRPKFIDLPEEISQGKAGDTLVIIKSTPNVLTLGFTGKHI